MVSGILECFLHISQMHFINYLRIGADSLGNNVERTWGKLVFYQENPNKQASKNIVDCMVLWISAMINIVDC